LYLKTENQDVIVFMALFSAVGFRFLPSFVRIITSFQHLRFYMSLTDNLSKELKLEVVNSIDEKKEIIFENEIIFKNINFHFPNKLKLLTNLNFNIKNKSITAFIGSTGSGKTTLINIILGIIQPISGEILVDKKVVNLNNLNWKKKIGYVPQRIFLNDDSIKNNIAFGVPIKEISLDKINYAVYESQLDSYIKGLKDGIETIVGENGIQLSGGQIQRIGIARALYNKPEILILDEATSNLDSETEKRLISSIINMSKKTTIIMVSHQDRPLKMCDSIFKIEEFTIIRVY
jgi:ABC-type bacteriocin/lantibiotic exporter with double-glycine peptidase domain